LPHIARELAFWPPAGDDLMTVDHQPESIPSHLFSFCAKCHKPEEMEQVGQSTHWHSEKWLPPNAKAYEVRDICDACLSSFSNQEALLAFLKTTPISPKWAQYQKMEIAISYKWLSF
jgi:hypothetical protein